jgi:enoyl-CoA hydratase/carnithine racemase
VSEYLRLDIADSVATLVIDRPAKRNALSFDMWAGIPKLVAEVAADDSVRVLLLTGGEHFSAGADISEFAELRADAAGARRYAEGIHTATDALTGLAKPTIAAINGFCIGGGCEVALACDLRIAADNAQFGITPAKLGIVYMLPSTKQLVDAVGPAWAKQILFSADIIDAATALRIGLVNELHMADDVIKRATELAHTMAARSQVTIRGAKEIIGRITAGRFEEDEAVHALYAGSAESADYAEGVRAFLDKRTPKF